MSIEVVMLFEFCEILSFQIICFPPFLVCWVITPSLVVLQRMDSMKDIGYVIRNAKCTILSAIEG